METEQKQVEKKKAKRKQAEPMETERTQAEKKKAKRKQAE